MRVLAVLLIVFLAGCLATEAPEAPEPEPESRQVDELYMAHDGLGQIVETDLTVRGGFSINGMDASEPTLGIDQEGHLYMTANRLSDGAAVIMASHDKGATWIDIGPHLGPVAPEAPRHPTTTDPYVVVDEATGRIWTADLLHNCVELSWTDDEGETWTTNPNGCGAPGILDHQTLVAAPPRTLPTTLYPNLLYICANEITHLDCATSLDGGLTWGPQRIVDDRIDTEVCSALTGHLAAGPEGRVYLPTTSCPTGGGIPVIYRTEDDGLTWTRHDVTNDEAFATAQGDHDVAVSVDDDGNVYANWLDKEARVRLAVSQDHGETWSTPIDVTIPGIHATAYNQVAAGAAGKVAVVYIGTEAQYTDAAGGGSGLDQGGALWHAYFGILLDAFVEDPVIHSVQVTQDSVATGECGRLRCGGFVDFISMEVDPEGRPWATMVEVHEGGQDRAGVVTLLEGPSLRGDTLTPLSWT